MRQELIDQLLAVANQIDSEAFARGQGGGAIYTQEQVDQMLSQLRSDLKSQFLAAYDAAQASESSVESSFRSQIESM